MVGDTVTGMEEPAPALPSDGTAQPPTPRGRPGGRPRDPALDGRIIEATIDLLAGIGYGAMTADHIAAQAGIGKASMYRRWRSVDALVSAVVVTLGPAIPPPLASPREELAALLADTCRGRRARAAMAVLSALPRHPQIAAAYAAGPEQRLDQCLAELALRAGGRWAGDTRVRAAVALLQHRALTGGPVDDDAIADVLDQLAPAPEPVAG